MKKILVLLGAVLLLLGLTACSGKEGATTPPTTTAPDHVHNYSSTEKPATCKEKGLETFTCACGHTYNEELPMLEHTWGEWLLTKPALLNKDGAETRTCSVCSATESKVSKENAMENSFGDSELQYLFAHWNGVNGDLTAGGLLAYFSQKYEGREESPMVISSEEMFKWLSQRFALTEELKAEMKQNLDPHFRYDKATDTFSLDYVNKNGELWLMGYIPGEGNKYTVYFESATWDGTSRIDGIWAVEIEHNLPDGQPNKYLSATKVNSIPDKVVS